MALAPHLPIYKRLMPHICLSQEFYFTPFQTDPAPRPSHVPFLGQQSGKSCCSAIRKDTRTHEPRSACRRTQTHSDTEEGGGKCVPTQADYINPQSARFATQSFKATVPACSMTFGAKKHPRRHTALQGSGSVHDERWMWMPG
jgi:hypothetical protein